jgi:hypothetical protein
MSLVKVPSDDDEEDDDPVAHVETVLCSLTPGKVSHAIPWRVELTRLSAPED